MKRMAFGPKLDDDNSEWLNDGGEMYEPNHWFSGGTIYM